METVSCAPCKAREKEKVSSHWCVTCEELLCPECTDTHKVMKVSRDHQLFEVSKIPKQMNISDLLCSKHDNLPYEYFCIDHDVLCCKECLASIHRTCKNVMSVDMASKGGKKSQGFVDSVELIKQFLETIDSLTSDSKRRIGNIEQEVSKIRGCILEAKKKITSHLDFLEQTLMQELNDKKDEIISNLQEKINEIQTIETQVKEKKDTFEMVEQHGTDKQAFLLTQNSRSTIEDIEQKLTSITDKATDSEIHFNTTNLQDNILSIGSLEIRESSCQIKFVPVKKRQSQVPVVRINRIPSLVYVCDIDMSKVGDYGIRGMTINERNELILCDFGNTRLLLYDENNTYKYPIKTKYVPWNIAVIPGTTTVVTSEVEDYKEFIDTERKKTIKGIKLENSSIGGITVSTEYIFVGANGKIHVLDHQGRSVRIINLQDTDRKPWFMCLGKNGNIYYTTPKCIVCIQSDGKVVFTSSNVKEPWGIQTDNHDNVYVIDNYNSAIHRFRSDGTVIDVLKDDVLRGPLSLYFNRDYSKLYVTNMFGNVSCFTLAQL